MLEIFGMVCVIFKFTSLKTFTPISVTFLEPYLIYWIFVAFWLKMFTETQSGQSIFGRQNGIIFKKGLHPKYPFDFGFQKNLNF